VLSPGARVRHGFAVGRLMETEATRDRHALPDELSEALADNTRSAVPEQAAFRLDFPRWRATLRRRDRNVLNALAGGERTEDEARRFRINPARGSRLRRELQHGGRALEAGRFASRAGGGRGGRGGGGRAHAARPG